MIGKKDVLIIALALVFAVALFAFRALWQSRLGVSRELRVYVNGELYTTAMLGVAREIVVEGANGERNVIVVDDDGFYMRSASCPDQLCVRQGEVTLTNFASRAMGVHVICLPNRVDVELLLTEDDNGAIVPDA